MFKKIKIITHKGSFHADDIFAVATLKIFLENKFFKPRIKIFRTRDLGLIKKGDFVVDVGMKYEPENLFFDHHQGGVGQRKNGIPFSSFGLVWKKYGLELCGKAEIFESIDNRLVQFFDACDNGIDIFELKNENTSVYGFCEMIECYNFIAKQDKKNSLKIFLKLVDLAKDILMAEILYASDLIFQKNELRNILKNNPNKFFVVLEKDYDDMVIQKMLINYPDILFLIAPDKGNNAWKLKTIRKNPNTFESRRLLPESWAGKRGEELVQITGIFDAVFCHNGRFIAFVKSKESALKMVKMAI